MSVCVSIQVWGCRSDGDGPLGVFTHENWGMFMELSKTSGADIFTSSTKDPTELKWLVRAESVSRQ